MYFIGSVRNEAKYGTRYFKLKINIYQYVP
jgi:hypothetical protein